MSTPTPGAPRSIPQDVPPHILERLRGEGVTSLEQWRALGRRRLHLFGIVPSMVRQLDQLARGAP